jgi:LacI family transcriptional regulator
VLNNDATMNVTDDTRRKIYAAAEELNYQKRSLKSLHSKGIVALVQWYSTDKELGDLYYRAIRWGIENQLEASQYEVKHFLPSDTLPSMSDFAGIVALGKFSTAQLEVLKQSGKPLVIVDQDVLGEGVSCVVPDFANGIDRIIHYMQAAGYQTVGMIAGVEETSDGQALNDPRRQLFPQLAVDAGFSTPAIYAAPFTVEGGYQAMEVAITAGKLPDAFFVANDSMAIGAIKALQNAHINIPDDVSLFGFNNLAIGLYLNPTLSSVHVPTETMGATAVTMLIALSEEKLPQPSKLTVATSLKLRQSSTRKEH